MKRLAAIALLGAMVATTASSGCGGEDAARPPALVAMTPLDASRSGETTSIVDAEAPESALPPVRAPRLVPEPVFGDGSVKPGDPHPFRLAVAIAVAQKNVAAAQLLDVVDRMPDVSEWESRTGIPLLAGDALLVYGKDVALPGANAAVLRLPRALGMTPSPAIQLFGVRDALLHPLPTVVALVPTDRANDFDAVLKSPFDLGLERGEIARIAVAELRFFPLAEVARKNLLVVVKPAGDHGLDAAIEVECAADAAKCASVASDFNDFVARNNGIMVRVATRGILNGFTARASGKKLKATLHVTPEQMDSLLKMASAFLGLPEVRSDAGAP